MDGKDELVLRRVAVFHSPLPEKFGVPRQSGLAPGLLGRIELLDEFHNPDALRGLDGFDYLWLIWGFNLNDHATASLTVRPPRLGGNARMGVFATRSPFRPNPLGLSSVRIERVDYDACEIWVSGADLADGTAIYDIKPYVEYADSHFCVRNGFVGDTAWEPLEVEMPSALENELGPSDAAALREILSLDPRPAFHDDPDRIYAMSFRHLTIRFHVNGNLLTVLS